MSACDLVETMGSMNYDLEKTMESLNYDISQTIESLNYEELCQLDETISIKKKHFNNWHQYLFNDTGDLFVESMIHTVESLNREELCELDSMVSTRKKWIENQYVISDIKNLFEEKEYLCVWNHGPGNPINPIQLDKDLLEKRRYSPNVISEQAHYICPGLRVTWFPLFVGTRAPDHKLENWEIDELEKLQNDWVKYTGCDYQPIGDENLLVDLSWDHESSLYGLDDTFGTGTLYMEVYYKTSDPPKEGEKFRCFDSDGKICGWEVVDGKLYAEDEENFKCDVYFGVLDSWDNYGMFVIDDELNQ